MRMVQFVQISRGPHGSHWNDPWPHITTPYWQLIIPTEEPKNQKNAPYWSHRNWSPVSALGFVRDPWLPRPWGFFFPPKLAPNAPGISASGVANL